MTEETVVVAAEVPAEVVETSPVETQAREQGWVSKEEWVEGGRNETEWRPAKEFVERGEIFKSLHSVKRELKQEKAAREALQRHHQYVFDKAYQTAVNDLKLQRRQAIRSEDFETADIIEEEMETLKQQHVQEKIALQQASQAAATPMPEFEAWMGNNPWYTTDQELRDFADAIGIVYANRRPGVQPGEVLEHVQKEVRKKYPEKFGAKRAAPSPVAGVQRSGTSRGSEMELDELETHIMKSLVASGEMTETQYRAELKKAKGIK